MKEDTKLSLYHEAVSEVRNLRAQLAAAQEESAMFAEKCGEYQRAALAANAESDTLEAEIATLRKLLRDIVEYRPMAIHAARDYLAKDGKS